MFGVTEFSAVINPPQAAILAVGKMEPRAVVRDGEVVARNIMTLTLVCDHRILYGADAARVPGPHQGAARAPDRSRALDARHRPAGVRVARRGARVRARPLRGRAHRRDGRRPRDLRARLALVASRGRRPRRALPGRARRPRRLGPRRHPHGRWRGARDGARRAVPRRAPATTRGSSATSPTCRCTSSAPATTRRSVRGRSRGASTPREGGLAGPAEATVLTWQATARPPRTAPRSRTCARARAPLQRSGRLPPRRAPPRWGAGRGRG